MRALLGIDYPVIQAPIGSASTAELAAAVSNAGALGSLAVSWREPHDVRRLVEQTEALTTRSFAVNVVLRWDQHRRVAVALETGAKLVWTSWGDPAPYAGPVHAAGALLIHTVGSAEEAERAVAEGVDLLVLQGAEAGGHVCGAASWQSLLPEVRRGAAGVPIVVAGGIADGRDVARALAAGADGACLGTRFVCAAEAAAAPEYQNAIIRAKPGDTVLTTLYDKGWPEAPHRVIRNSTVRAWEAAGCPEPGNRPGERDVVATAADGTPVERYSDVIPTRGVSGRLEELALYAGESAARIGEVLPAAEIVARLVHQAGLSRGSS